MIKRIKEYKGTLRDRKNKTIIYIINTFLLINMAVAIYFIYSLLLLTGIETGIRIGIIVLAVFIALLFIYWSMGVIIKNKVKKYLIFILCILLSIGIQGFVAYNINKIHGSLNKINKNSVTYTTDLIVMKNNKAEKIEDIEDMTIGIISEEKGLEDYTIGQEIIKENNLKDSNKIKQYDDYFEMLNDLYEGNIDSMFVSSNYSIMFSSYEKFQNIKDEVKVITSKSKDFKKKTTTSISSKNVVKEPFTVLLMGVDSETEGLDKNAAFNGDSLMLITFNPNTLNTTVLSIPRDTYVPIMCFKNHKQNKITHAAWYGVDCMEQTIENFTGINIDYYVKMNFKGVVSLVDALGGIDVDVPFKFCEQNSDREWDDQTICLDTGEQHLNGEQALALARHRKTLALGDIQRGLNQQIVIQGMLSKLGTIDSIDKVNNLLDTVSSNMDTNLSTDQILSFYNVGKDILLKSAKTNTDDLISMQKLYLDGYTKMIYDEGFGMNLSNYVYYESSLKAVVNAMKVNLGQKEEELVKTFDFSINEIYEQEVIGQGKTDSTSIITTLPNFVGSSKSYTSSWCNARNINTSFVVVRKGDSDYNDSYSDGQVISQSISAGTEISKIKSITFKVISKDKDDTTNNKNNTTTDTNTNTSTNEITFSIKQTEITLTKGDSKHGNFAGIVVKEGTKDVTSSASFSCDIGPYDSLYGVVASKTEKCTVSYKGKTKTWNILVYLKTETTDTPSKNPDPDPDPDTDESNNSDESTTPPDNTQTNG